MKLFLIIPMGGKGQRFLNSGYKIYKPFLKVSKKIRIIDGLINNFDHKKTEIILIGNKKRIKKNDLNFKNKIHFINIANHKLGPLYSIFLAREKIKKITTNNNCFVCYSDINWKWNWNRVKKFIRNKKVVIFTHKGFHPHLEIDSKSDFCLVKKNNIIDMREKKLFHPDYKENFLATGCYYFKSFYLIEKHLNIFKKKSKINKEIYLVNLIKNLIKNNIKIIFFNINKFVHLGLPSQYEDFINWQDIFLYNFDKSLKLKNKNIMLMAGKGARVKELGEKKPFLKIKKNNFYDYIFYKFGTINNSIVTTDYYFKYLKKKYSIFKINKTDSMLETLEKSKYFFKEYKNFFITSCDCFGIFSKTKFLNLIKNNKPDVILFSFNFSESHKKLKNSHTVIIKKKNKMIDIKVKNNSAKDKLGHAGFFWIKDVKVFKFLQEFKQKVNLKREYLLDDYFKYLFKYKKFKIDCLSMENYVHIGSTREYKELVYWENYFCDEN